MKEEKKKSKIKKTKEKGITLIVLVITIVILIILATVTLNVVLGEGGLIQRAEQAKDLTEDAQVEEQIQLIILSARMENIELYPNKFKASIENNLTAEFDFDGQNTITHTSTGKKYFIDEEYNTLSPISTKEDLANIQQNGKYILVNDIDLSGMKWTPIPTFSGKFDGNSHAINGMTINKPDVGGQALFSVVNGGKIKNLALTNIDVTAMNAVGGIASIIQNNTIIENCFVTGRINAVRSVGGIAGYMQSNSVIKNCYTTCSINTTITGSTWTRAGGIVGSSDEGSSTITIENCYSTSRISALSPYSGSIIGYNISSQIRNCYGLSPSISGSYIGRIFGTGSTKGENNYGYEGTLINNATVSSSDTTSNNGADIDLSDLQTQTHYSTNGRWGFDNNGPWTFDYASMNVEEGTNLPVLKSFTNVMQNPKI